MFSNTSSAGILAAALTLSGVSFGAAIDVTGCDALVAAGFAPYYPGSNNYTAREESFWATDARLSPSCIIQPANTAEVAAVVEVLSSASGNFSVRSGGHSHWAGGSDIHVGVTIDLGLMTAATYDASTSTASIEPGPNWGQVYTALAEQGACVTGGRDAGVGIGGFLTGGGNSYYTGKTGFACDTIVNLEVVLANGTVVNANASSNADLWKALKGGSGNFGIVTRFDVEAFAVNDLWGGLRAYNRSYGDDIITGFVNFGNDNEQNPEDAYIINFTYNPADFDEIIISSVIVDTNGVVNASAFDEMYTIPVILEDVSTRSMTEIATVYELASGYYNTWFSLTLRNDETTLQYAAILNDNFVATILTLIPAADVTTQCVFQPIPTYFSDISEEKGGNVFGLNNYKNNAVMWLLTVETVTADQMATIRPYIEAFNSDLETYASANGALGEWRYINYVDPSQDPLASYGTENIAFLKEVAAKYDPSGVFQTKSPSGFKLSACTGC